MTLRGLVELSFFIALACAVHAVVFWVGPESKGLGSAGAEGDSLISLAAASPSVQEMVERFDNPARTMPELAEPLPPPRLEMPKIELPPLPAMLDLPRISTPPQERPPEPKPEVEATTAAPKVSKPPQPKPKQQTAEPPPRKAAPAPKRPAPQSRDSTAQRAEGLGGQTAAGTRRSESTTSLPAERRANLIQQWGNGQIRSRIERRKSYPSAAGRASGTVTLRVTVTLAGRLAGVSILNSSGNSALDRAAISAVQAASPFPRAPAGLTKPSYSFSIALRFTR
ncbi:energy transducer TonB family protein [Thioclava marina]|uniref:energy transducer TonB family protein n=1 Tax=Thioclava marina TaxID=1915077 RepID=UPI0009970DCE|nr:TonB family protein [Thioclava marina]